MIGKNMGSNRESALVQNIAVYEATTSLYRLITKCNALDIGLPAKQIKRASDIKLIIIIQSNFMHNILTKY